MVETTTMVEHSMESVLRNYSVSISYAAFVRSLVDYLRENGEVTPDDLTNDVPFVNYDIGSLFEDRISQLREIIARLNKISGSEAA